MRVACEACGREQPLDWKPGDACVHCGGDVRRDLRCHWCVRPTPAGRFCRHCGAETVAPADYGVARMLKEAGVDRFEIPARLARLDPEGRATLARIYERHAAVAARHVDDVRIAERFLRQRPWSAALDDELNRQLPWPDETLERLAAAVVEPAGDALATLRALCERSPHAITRQLAALARLALDDASAHEPALAAFHAGDPALRLEAAHTVTSWRVLATVGPPRALGRAVHDELRGSPFRLDAAVALGVLGEPDEDLLREALASTDRHLSLGAALALGDVDRLNAGLRGDAIEQIAAGRRLVSLGVIAPVAAAIADGDDHVKAELVEALALRKEPMPDAADVLFDLVTATPDPALRAAAVRVLCRALRPAWVLPLARAADGDSRIYQSLLQAHGHTSESAVALGDFLLENDRFHMSQFGLSTLAEKGTMPPTFVPRRLAEATPETQVELLRFAEAQLTHADDEALRRFVTGVVLGPYPGETRCAAGWALRRVYGAWDDSRGHWPLRLPQDEIDHIFGSTSAFLGHLVAVLRDRKTLDEVGYSEAIAAVLTSLDDGTVAALQRDRHAPDLVDALVEPPLESLRSETMEAMITLASRLGTDPRLRAAVLAGIRRVDRTGSYAYQQAMRRLQSA